MGWGGEGVSGGKSLRNLSGERVENNASAFLSSFPPPHLDISWNLLTFHLFVIYHALSTQNLASFG